MELTYTFRRTAMSLRHGPVLQRLTPVWTLLRQPYVWSLTALGSEAGIVVPIGDCRIRLTPEFARVAWESVEVETFRVFASTVRRGDTIIDIGAYIGAYSLVGLLLSAPDGRVVAYEPATINREYLLRHLRMNAVADRAIVRPCCCGSRVGETDFFCRPGEPDSCNGALMLDGFEKQSAKIATVDSEITHLGLRPNVIKIDVEGAEWEVLKGAESTLRTHRPVLFLSLHPPALQKLGVEAASILDWLSAQEYAITVIAIDHEVHVLARPAA